jgi:hypothetical protein
MNLAELSVLGGTALMALGMAGVLVGILMTPLLIPGLVVLGVGLAACGLAGGAILMREPEPSSE